MEKAPQDKENKNPIFVSARDNIESIREDIEEIDSQLMEDLEYLRDMLALLKRERENLHTMIRQNESIEELGNEKLKQFMFNEEDIKKVRDSIFESKNFIEKIRASMKENSGFKKQFEEQIKKFEKINNEFKKDLLLIRPEQLN